MRRKSSVILTLVIIFAVLGFIGFTGTMSDSKDIKGLSSQMRDFNEIPIAEFKEGEYVEGYVNTSFGEFMYVEEESKTMGVTTNTKVVDHYYTVLLYQGETPVVMGLETKQSDIIDLMEALTENTYDYYADETDIQWVDVFVSGCVEKMTDEDLGYCQEYLMDVLGYTSVSEVDEMIVPYYVRMVDLETAKKALGVSRAFMIVGIAGIAVMVAIFVISRTAGRRSASPSSSGADNYRPADYTQYNNTSGRTGTAGSTQAYQSTDMSQSGTNGTANAQSGMDSISSSGSYGESAESDEVTSADLNPGTMDDIDLTAMGITDDDFDKMK